MYAVSAQLKIPTKVRAELGFQLQASCFSNSPYQRKMATVHFTTIPCEPNTTKETRRKLNIWGKIIPLLTLCRAGLEVFCACGL